MAKRSFPLGKVYGAPLIDECYASLECKVADTGMVAGETIRLSSRMR